MKQEGKPRKREKRPKKQGSGEASASGASGVSTVFGDPGAGDSLSYKDRSSPETGISARCTIGVPSMTRKSSPSSSEQSGVVGAWTSPGRGSFPFIVLARCRVVTMVRNFVVDLTSPPCRGSFSHFASRLWSLHEKLSAWTRVEVRGLKAFLESESARPSG